jgi:DNA-binding NarL/FixJ family response regulator
METIRPSTSLTRILIADDHVIFAEALQFFLEKTYSVIGSVADGRSMIEEAIRLRPDVIVADISMPLLNGLDAAQRVHEVVPHVKFVFLTMHNDPNLAAAALEIGQVAFVLKHEGGQALAQAIERVMHGRSYMTPKLRATDWVEVKARARQYSRDLTKRQRDVVQLFAEGRPVKEIASILDLSEKTVEFHKHHIMEAFNVSSNADLVLFALKRGLITVDSGPHYRVAPSQRTIGEMARS